MPAHLPTLANGGFWNLSKLYSTGEIEAVPEPATWVLLALGGAALWFLRRRSPASR